MREQREIEKERNHKRNARAHLIKFRQLKERNKIIKVSSFVI
jgi:hypothetical protein